MDFLLKESTHMSFLFVIQAVTHINIIARLSYVTMITYTLALNITTT